MNSADFLDELKIELELKTDYQLGKELDISHSRISMYRTGKREFDVLTCVAVADVLALPMQYVMAEIEAARAKNPKVREVWQIVAHLAKKAQAAALVMAITSLLNLSPAGVSQAKDVSEAAPLTIYTLYARVRMYRRKGKAKGARRNTVLRALRRSFAAWVTLFRPAWRYGE